MEVRLGLLDRKNRFYSRSVGFRKLLKHGSLEQENHREALKALTVMAEGKPRPQFLVTDDDPCSLQHVLDCDGKRINTRRPRPLPDCNSGCLADLIRDLVQPWVRGYDSSVQVAQYLQGLGLQLVRYAHTPEQSSPMCGARRKFIRGIPQCAEPEDR